MLDDVFTFQYGSTLMRKKLINLASKGGFTFQYGSTLINGVYTGGNILF